MKPMGELEIKKDISSKNLKPCYLIAGNDAYLKRFYVGKLCSSAFSGDETFNMQKFTDDSSISEVYDAVWQFPLMADRKCVLLTDFDYTKCAKDEFERLLELFSDPCDTTVFVLYFNRIEPDKKVDRTKKLFAAADKLGGMVQLDHRSRNDLCRMLMSGAEKRGAILNSITAGYIIECCGEDIGTLNSELEKLCAYARNREIKRADVDKVCVRTVENSVYNLARAITSLRLSDSLCILDELFFLRVEPAIILHTLGSAYVDMARVLFARNAGLKTNDVVADFGYKGREFVVTKAADSLRRFDEDKLRSSLSAIINADSSLKSQGADAKTVLQVLVCELYNIIAPGRALR